MPSLSKASDNLGLIFSSVGSFVSFDIELFGQGLGDIGLFNGGITAPCGAFTQTPFPTNSGSGGYTKLSMVVPLDKTISFQPNFYRGGDDSRTETFNGTPSTTTTIGEGGDASAFAIDGEWMAIAGGSGRVGWTGSIFQVTSGTCPGGYGISIYQSSITNVIPPTTNGSGGVNILNPTASPSIGGTSFSSATSTQAGSFPNLSYNFNGTLRGAGGGGAPGGRGAGITTTIAEAGKGNIRIYADTNGISTSGSIASVPGVTMQLVSSADGFWLGQSKVVVTSPVTGLSTTFTQDTDMTGRELKALLEPKTEMAFDVELFGQGIGSNPNLSNISFFGPPSSDTVTPVANNSGLGGYTKLRVISPISSNISAQPRLYRGGLEITTAGSVLGSGGDGSAFSIDGQWMAIAGGSGRIKYRETSSYSYDSSGTVIQRFGTSTISELIQPVVQGRGGVNVTNPTASPQNGQNSSITYTSTLTPSGPTSGNLSSNGTLGGGGGGGAPGGPAWVGISSAQGGGGNIRVWAETALSGIATSKGDLTSVSGVYMRLLNSSNGTSSGVSKVVIRSPITGIAVTYFNDSTFSIQSLRSILYPGIVF